MECRTPRNDTSGQERTTGETGKTVKEGEQPYEISDEFLNWHCDRIDDVPRKCLVIMAFGDKETIEYKNNMAVFLKIIKPCV